MSKYLFIHICRNNIKNKKGFEILLYNNLYIMKIIIIFKIPNNLKLPLKSKVEMNFIIKINFFSIFFIKVITEYNTNIIDIFLTNLII